MAFYVLLLKESEDDEKVIYRFGPNEEKLGRLKLNKNNGEVKEIEPVPIDNISGLFPRAAAKLYQHWREGNFPDKSSWAS